MKRRDKNTVVYFLPNLFTTANLFCGFYAIVASLQNLYIAAAMAIFFAGVFDSLDGRVARLTKLNSKFGEEYDSLADLVSFGLAPAMLMYLWSIESFGRIGWLACFVYLACGALRLARFNVKTSHNPKAFFEGLPIPMAAYTISTTVFLFHELMLEEYKNPFNLILMVGLAFLMVSAIPYKSFKDFDLKNKKSFGYLVTAVFILMVVAYRPEVMMFVVMMTYLISGIILLPWTLKKVRSYPQTENPKSLQLIEKTYG